MLDAVERDGALVVGYAQHFAIGGELRLSHFPQVALEAGEVHEHCLSVHVHDSQGIVLPLGIAKQQFSRGVEGERVTLGGQVAELFQ